MKKILLVGLMFALLIFCLPGLVFGQSMPVNIHQYSTDILTQDSGGVVFTYPVKIQGLDCDTSESFDLSTFTSLSSCTKFKFHSWGHDSLCIGIGLAVTIDDSTWSMVDSITAASLTATLIAAYSGADSTYCKAWTFPKCKKGRFYYFGTLKTTVLGSVWIYNKIFKQR